MAALAIRVPAPVFITATLILSTLISGQIRAQQDPAPRKFAPEIDLLSLHYDHAPDKDDGQSGAADRTILESLFGCDWIKDHVVAVSGGVRRERR